ASTSVGSRSRSPALDLSRGPTASGQPEATSSPRRSFAPAKVVGFARLTPPGHRVRVEWNQPWSLTDAGTAHATEPATISLPSRQPADATTRRCSDGRERHSGL